jgi:hypothetical protein
MQAEKCTPGELFSQYQILAIKPSCNALAAATRGRAGDDAPQNGRDAARQRRKGATFNIIRLMG